MRKTCSVFVALFMALVVYPVEAQDRLLTGTVVDSASGTPLEGARVTVRGTALGTLAGANGRFALRGVPAGEFGITVRMIGYRAVDRQARAGDTDLRIALVRDPLELDEVVVTGQATAIERRNLANAIATVSGEDVSRVSSPSVENALQGKVVGAIIQTNGGAPGGGLQVQMRGVTSINAASDPLYVVDGVVMSNAAIPSNQNAITRAAGGSNPSLTQDAQVNRIADLNPNEIESIEVLKGASAAAIYGSRASNGVVIITTKRGAPGAPRFGLTQRIGFAQASNTLGTRTFNTLEEALDVWGDTAAVLASFQPGRTFDHEDQLAHRTPLLTETVLDLSGGSENTQYFLSGLWKEDGGIIDNTGYQKQSIRANLDQQFGSRMNLDVGVNITRTLAQRGLSNNDNASVSYYMVLPFTPNFVDLSRNDDDGTWPCNPFIGNCSNPLQTASLMRNDEVVWRYFGSGRLGINAFQSETQTLRFNVLGGVDYFIQENDLFFPPELNFEGDDGEPGTVLLSNTHSLNLNVGANAVHGYSPSSAAFTATTSLGMSYADRDQDLSRITSRNIVGGLDIVSAGTNVQVIGQRQRVETVSLFAQEEVLMLDDRLLLTAGINADQTSANSDDKKLYFYPKAAGSYRFVSPISAVDELKLRAAYGESGNQPLFGQKFTPLTATQNIAGLPALVTQGTVGATDLRPERQREVEAGIDATMLDRRATLELTLYQKNVTDLLLQRTLAPSTGFATEIFNGGELRTRGFELGVGVIPIQTANAEWVSRVNFFRTRSKILDLPVPTFRAGGFGTALGAFEIAEGASPTQIVGNDTLPDGSGIVRKVGDATPDFNMSFTNDVRFGRFQLSGLLDWQQGGTIVNLTKFLFDLGQNTVDFADPITVGGEETTVGARRLELFGRQTAVFLEDASYVKLREVTLAYTVPEDLVARVWSAAQYAVISVSGRNLLTFTDYTGLDPEVSNFGNQNIARNIDVAPFPPSRSFWFSVRVGF
jgi:TonB-linked SusC/RagA family outer membrane protein